jgi:hypothetical protein
MKRATEVDRAIIAESARWGAYRRDPPYTRDADWLPEQRRLMNSYFPRRTAIVLEQLRAAGLFPKLPAPVLTQRAGTVVDGFELSMTAAGGGTIYFTTNGVDPRVYGSGTVSPSALAYAKPWSIHGEVQVKARVLKDTTWSALASAPWTNPPPRPAGTE